MKTAMEPNSSISKVSGDSKVEEAELGPPCHTHGEELEKDSSS